MELSWGVEREDGVSLVRCRLHNDEAVPRRVRLQNRLDGPVLPPRRGGVPEAGWDEDGVTVRLDPDQRRALGYATPAEPVDPPVELTVEEAAEAGGEDPSPTAADAVRELGTYRPPREAVPAAPEEAGSVGPRDDSVGAGGESNNTTTDDVAGIDVAETGDVAEIADVTADADDTSGAADARRAELDDPADPDRAEAWLDAVERRIRRGERLVDADVATATTVVAAAGGVDAIAELDSRLEGDAARLRRISDRADALAARAERADVPTDALERLS
ncbi:hypothetical protein JCM18237_19940 [Halorubrum luteum]